MPGGDAAFESARAVGAAGEFASWVTISSCTCVPVFRVGKRLANLHPFHGVDAQHGLRQPPGEGGDPSGRGCPARRQTKHHLEHAAQGVFVLHDLLHPIAHGKGSRLVGAAHFRISRPPDLLLRGHFAKRPLPRRRSGHVTAHAYAELREELVAGCAHGHAGGRFAAEARSAFRRRSE